MTYSVVTALWTGFTGAPGYTRMKWNGDLTTDDLALAAGKQHAFFASINPYLPADVTISWDGQSQTYDDQGVLTDAQEYTPPGNVTGASPSNVAGPAGVVVRWLTGSYQLGRRIVGRTFVVPLATNAYEPNGSMEEVALSVIQGAADNLVAGDPLLAIFSHPMDTKTDPPTPKAPPITAIATSAQVKDKVAVLRSRRD